MCIIIFKRKSSLAFEIYSSSRILYPEYISEFHSFIETRFSISKRRDNSSSIQMIHKHIIFRSKEKFHILGKRIKQFSKSVTTLHRFVSAHYPSTSFFPLRFAIRFQDLFRLIYIHAIFWKKTLNVRETHVRLLRSSSFLRFLRLFREKINLFRVTNSSEWMNSFNDSPLLK